MRTASNQLTFDRFHKPENPRSTGLHRVRSYCAYCGSHELYYGGLETVEPGVYQFRILCSDCGKDESPYISSEALVEALLQAA